MRYVKKLSEAEKVTLQEMQKHHRFHWTRMRAHAILLSGQGYSHPEIGEIYGVCRQTVSTWLMNWESRGVVGLLEQARSGRPRKLNAEEEEQALEWLQEDPRLLKQVRAKLEKRLGKRVSVSTIKRLCKRAGLVWKRMRKSLKEKRDEQAFEESVERLARLLIREAQGEIDVYYFDESGFTLVPSIPYAWQPRGKTCELPSSHSRRLNVLGFMNRDNDVYSYVFEGTIDASVVVACFEEFLSTRPKNTVVIIDNSPLHTSQEFEEPLERWNAKGLQVEFIAPYSPELNLIEILWRKIKYQWLPVSAYESFAKLKEELFKILANIGTEYRIAFS